MPAHKLLSRGLLEYLREFDIIMLSETRRQFIDLDMWVGFKVSFHPASEQSKAGEGLFLAVKRSPYYHILPYSTKDTSLWAKLQFQCGGPPLIVGTTYIPPSGSPLLSRVPLHTRLSHLKGIFCQAIGEGHVLLGGDFNARVGIQVPMVPGTDSCINSHGKALNKAITAVGGYLCTGRVKGDIPAVCTFHARGRSVSTRLDHIIVSPSLLPQLHETMVDRTRLDSDHSPIISNLTFNVSPQAPATDDGIPLRQFSWRPSLRAAYVQALQSDDGNHSTACIHAIQAGDLAGSLSALYSYISNAAQKAGMILRSAIPRPYQRMRSQPFFDTECRKLRREVWRLGRRVGWQGDVFKRLERRYHALVRRKRRAHQFQRACHTLEQLKSDPKKVWTSFQDAPERLPQPLRSVRAWDSFVQSLAGSPSGISPLTTAPLDAYPWRHNPMTNPEELIAPFSCDEIEMSLNSMSNGRSPGLLGLPAEFFKYARPVGVSRSAHMLTALLTDIFNLAFTTNTLPTVENVCLVTPIHKKGDAFDTGNYRPIAVGDSLVRLYSSVLNSRLVAYLEKHHLRDDTQTGFRPGLSTVHQLFVVQHLLDMVGDDSPLIFAFLDFSKAYDKLVRPHLWTALEQLGIPPQFLSALRAILDNTWYAIRVEGRRGPSFLSHIGVPQGNPISPTLFGVFSDGLPQYLKHRCPGVGVTLPDGTCVQILGYADDFALVATSQEDLQLLLDATQAWCEATCMYLNVPKTQVLPINFAPGTQFGLTCRGGAVPVVEEALYLGLHIHHKTGLQASIEKLEQRFWAAWNSVKRRYSNLGCAERVAIMLDLYLACLPPVISYGCEVWAFREFNRRGTSSSRFASTRLLGLHRKVLSHILGVHNTTPEDIILYELNLHPLWATWLLRMARFWNSVVEMRPDAVHHRVLLHSLQLAITTGQETFAGTLLAQLKKIGFHIDAYIGLGQVRRLNIQQVKDLLARREAMLWEGLEMSPRTCASERAMFCRYLRWFARPPHAPHPRSVYRAHIPPRTLKTFIRFRLGCHGLPVEVGRREGVPRCARLCTRCSTGIVGDEHHLLFTCPAVEHIRTQFPQLFQIGTRAVQTFMWQRDLAGVATFVSLALQAYHTSAVAP